MLPSNASTAGRKEGQVWSKDLRALMRDVVAPLHPDVLLWRRVHALYMGVADRVPRTQVASSSAANTPLLFAALCYSHLSALAAQF